LFSLGDLAHNVIHLVLLPVYTRYLDPAAFGLIASLGIISALVSRVTNCGYDWTLQGKYFLLQSLADKKLYVGTYLIIGCALRTIVLSVLLSLATWALPPFFPGWDHTYTECLWFLMIFLVLDHANQIYVMLAKLQSEALTVCYAQVTQGLVTAAATIVLLVVFSQGAVAIYFGQLIGLLASCLLFAFSKLRAWASFSISRKAIADLCELGLPVWPVGFCTWMGKFADQFCIQLFLGPSQLGLYVLGIKFREAIMILHSAFNSSTLSDVSRTASQGIRSSDLRKWILLASSAMSLAVVMPITMSKEIVMKLFAPAFLGASDCIAFLLVLPISGFTGYLNNLLVASGRSRIISYLHMLLFPVMAGCIYITAIEFGITGIVLTLWASQLILNFVLIAFANDMLHFRGKDYLHMICLSMLGLITAFLSVFVFDQAVLARLGIGALAAVGVFIIDVLSGRLLYGFIRILLRGASNRVVVLLLRLRRVQRTILRNCW
jgi:O-antigen/teichoic acid export membrane protein